MTLLGGLLGLAWSVSARAAPQISAIVELAEGSSACARSDQTHSAALPLVLAAPALVFAKASSWDRAEVQVGLSDGGAPSVSANRLGDARLFV